MGQKDPLDRIGLDLGDRRDYPNILIGSIPLQTSSFPKNTSSTLRNCRAMPRLL